MIRFTQLIPDYGDRRRNPWIRMELCKPYIIAAITAMQKAKFSRLILLHPPPSGVEPVARRHGAGLAVDVHRAHQQLIGARLLGGVGKAPPHHAAGLAGRGIVAGPGLPLVQRELHRRDRAVEVVGVALELQRLAHGVGAAAGQAAARVPFAAHPGVGAVLEQHAVGLERRRLGVLHRTELHRHDVAHKEPGRSALDPQLIDAPKAPFDRLPAHAGGNHGVALIEPLQGKRLGESVGRGEGRCVCHG